MDTYKREIKRYIKEYEKYAAIAHSGARYNKNREIECDSNGVYSFKRECGDFGLIYLTIMNQMCKYANEYIIKFAMREANKIANIKGWLFVDCLENPIEI